jgi:hypothetical protein
VATSLDLIVDLENVRGALGVTELDCDDNLISGLMFAPTSEAHVKAEIPTWATIIDADGPGYDESQAVRLRSAAVYYCAALLCKRLESGAIGLVSGGRQTPVDWVKRYSEMMSLYAQAIHELEVNPANPVAPDDVLPSVSFTMTHGPRAKSSWITDPPIAEVGPVLPE